MNMAERRCYHCNAPWPDPRDARIVELEDRVMRLRTAVRFFIESLPEELLEELIDEVKSVRAARTRG
jgi:hypothetical protein